MNAKKVLVTLLAAVLLVGCTIGGTLAWLMDTTDAVTNTFTTSDVSITLTESKDLDLQMVPGGTITKDPVVTVEAGSEDCYLFVKVEESDNFDTYMTYVIADGWIQLKDSNNTAVAGVFYREAKAEDFFPVLEDNEVKVLETVDKTMMTAANNNAPKLTFTAYAVQKENVADALTAWNLISST